MNRYLVILLALGSSLSVISLNAGAAAKEISCQYALEQADVLNAYDLWHGAGDCSATERQWETNFLLVVGQVRAMADMTALEPTSDKEGAKVGQLYEVLFYRTGGSGFNEVYRTEESSQALMSALEGWSGRFVEKYYPGWQYKRNVTATDYERMLHCQKALRVQKLEHYATLQQDDQYHALHQELELLLIENNSVTEEGSEVDKQHQKLREAIQSIRAQYPAPQDTPAACDGIG